MRLAFHDIPLDRATDPPKAPNQPLAPRLTQQDPWRRRWRRGRRKQQGAPSGFVAGSR